MQHSNSSSGLPLGASTEPKQDVGNTSLASIDTKTGEVSVTPTANTILDRLKSIYTKLVAGIKILGPTGNEAGVNSGGELSVYRKNGVTNTNNSSTATLLSGAVFTGTATSILDESFIFITVFADQDSAIDGLSIEQSSDGTNWDILDNYTIFANTGKVYSVQPASIYCRIRYTNGSTGQGVFRLHTIFKKSNSLPSSHRLQDSVKNDDDARLVKSVVAYADTNDGTFNNVSIQNPFPVDGDAVYSKDIWEDESNQYNFSGSVTDLFDNLHSVIEDVTANDPKEIFIHFNRTIIMNTLGLGANTGDFSNVKIIGVLSGNVEATLYDDSNRNTKFTTQSFQIPVTAGLNAIKIQFHTIDPVSISNLLIIKTRSNVARLQGVTPQGLVVDLNATTGGNFKVALEEIEPTVIVPLPTGASTEAEQNIINSNIESANIKNYEILIALNNLLEAQNKTNMLLENIGE